MGVGVVTESEAVSGRLTVPQLLRSAIVQFSNEEAVVGDGTRLTYEDLDRRSEELARALIGSGISKYGRVGLHAPNSVEWIVAWFAITRIGAVAVPLSTFASPSELIRSLRHSDCQALLARRGPRGHAPEMLDPVLPGIGLGVPRYQLEVPFLRCILDLTPLDQGPLPQPAEASIGHRASGVPSTLVDALEEQVHPSDPAMMIYTSGTTSEPKGVVHSHDAVTFQVVTLVDELAVDSDVRAYTTLPFFWVGGLALTALPTLAAGGTLYTTTGFEPAEVLRLIEEERLTRVSVYPAPNIAAVLAHPDLAKRDLTSVDRGVLGFPPGLKGRPAVADARDGLTMGLGMSETFSCYWWGTPDESDPVTPPLDRSAPGVEVKVVGDDGEPAADGQQGEIRVRGRTVTIGLQKVDRSEVFDADGFYRTGDIGLVDGTTVRYRGRAHDTIKTSGANVATAEVSAAILRIEGVADAHVVGLPDATKGEVVGALVVPRQGEELDVEDIYDRLRADLARYKVPTVIALTDDDRVPRTATSKVDAQAVRTLLQATRQGSTEQ